MPENTNVFRANGEFIEGIPYNFVIYARAGGIGDGDEEWEWVSRGKWERLFSVVGEQGEGLELEFTEWRCPSGQGRHGYLVCIFFSFLFFSFLFFSFLFFSFLFFSFLFFSFLFFSFLFFSFLFLFFFFVVVAILLIF